MGWRVLVIWECEIRHRNANQTFIGIDGMKNVSRSQTTTEEYE